MTEIFRMVQVYKCLCDETRLRILNLLRHGPLCGCHFQQLLEIGQVRISKHLTYLRRKNAVEVSRYQNWKIYSLPKTQRLELELNLKCLEDCAQSNAVLQADARRLQAMHKEVEWLGRCAA